MSVIAGIDIGGTKCAVSLGLLETDGSVHILDKEHFQTPSGPEVTIRQLRAQLDGLIAKHRIAGPAAVGISCGGPLDSRQGLLLSPPNLPGWDAVEITRPFREAYGVPAMLQNDANACAVAEWKWGAGQGTENMVFLTFGTGMGAGLILNGRLYSGTNDMAGEIGHVSMSSFGPVGYGKVGSFEGFCSGGGIADLARSYALAQLQSGQRPVFCPSFEALGEITARKVAEAAVAGDPLALEIMQVVGEQLGRGLAILIDVLNPQRIVIGSIYQRQQDLLEPGALEMIARLALPRAASVCEIVPSELGDRVGDYASLAVAYMAMDEGGS